MSEQRELTAMMELIEWINSGKYSAGSNTAADIHAKATELLVKEKSQIVNGWTTGWNDRGNDDGDFSQHEDGEDY
jgi:hypothetical protein